MSTAACADIHGTCSSQQAAAAWAWLQHGGGTCITPRRAEGLMAANLNAKCEWSRPSRFKMELMRRAAMEDIAAQHSRWVAEDGAACTKGQTRPRRHSFHVEDLAGLGATWSAQIVGADQDVMKGYDIHGHVDEASSLLDKFELEAVWRQLHQISTLNSMSNTERPAGAAAQKAQKAMSPPPELKPHHRSIDDLWTHKSWRSFSTRFHHHHHHHHGDDPHAGHHQYGHLLHQLLRFRSSRSPALCSSIATVDSIVDHHESVSPKKFRAHVVSQENLQKPPAPDHERSTEQIGRFSKQSGTKLKIPLHGIEPTVLLERADKGIAADQLQEKERFASSTSHRKLQAPLPQLLATPATRHHSYSKVLQSLIHRLPHSSHISHESGGNSCRSHLHLHDHQHFHHHHHYYHRHRLQHDDQQMGKDLVSAVQRPKRYSLHKLVSTHAECECSAEKEGGLHAADIEAEGRKSSAATSKQR